jgi:hypothetical protein
MANVLACLFLAQPATARLHKKDPIFDKILKALHVNHKGQLMVIPTKVPTWAPTQPAWKEIYKAHKAGHEVGIDVCRPFAIATAPYLMPLGFGNNPRNVRAR